MALLHAHVRIAVDMLGGQRIVICHAPDRTKSKVAGKDMQIFDLREINQPLKVLGVIARRCREAEVDCTWHIRDHVPPADSHRLVIVDPGFLAGVKLRPRR